MYTNSRWKVHSAPPVEGCSLCFTAKFFENSAASMRPPGKSPASMVGPCDCHSARIVDSSIYYSETFRSFSLLVCGREERFISIFIDRTDSNHPRLSKKITNLQIGRAHV